MFGFFGSRGSVSRHFDSTITLIEKEFNDDVIVHDSGLSDVCLASVGSGGSVLGFASTKTATLIYLGAIHEPFPVPLVGSPLDDPMETAHALLERYSQDEESFLDDIVGLYAVVLVDIARDCLLVARGPYGGPRIFIHKSCGALSFSTRLIDFAGLLGDEAHFDRSLEDFLLGYEFLPNDRTLIAGVKELGKGNLYVWRGETCSHRDLKELKLKPELLHAATATQEDALIRSLHDAFVESLRDQCPSKGKIGVLLGGCDSMLIASALKDMGREVETFTFRYKERGYTQVLVEELQQLLGIRHNWVDITPRVIEEGLAHFAELFNQPVSQPHYLIASAEAARVMKMRGIKHCITGDGCDGLFLGYPTVFARVNFIQRLSAVSGLLGPLLLWCGAWKWLEIKIGHPYRFFRNIGRILSRPMPLRDYISACTLDRKSLGFLREGTPPQEREPEAILAELAAGNEGASPLRLAYIGKGRVGLNAAKIEGITRCSGITFLSPYMHPRMTTVAGLIPDELNRPSETTSAKDTGKYIFFKMIEKYGLLPAKFVHQKKMSPVTSPVDLWYWGESRESILSMLAQLPFDVDEKYLVSLVTPKMAERWFRDNIGLSRHVTQAAGLLVTYAGYTRFLKRN